MTEVTYRSISILTWIEFPFWEVAIKSTLAIALTAITCQILGRQSAALRHRVWVIGLAAALLVPVALLLLPQFVLPVLPSKESAKATTQDRPASAPTSDAPSPVPDSSHGLAGSAPIPPHAPNQSLPAGSANAMTAQASADLSQRGVAGIPSIEQGVAAIWLLGVALSSMRFVMQLIGQRKRLRQLPKIDDADWVAAVTSAAQAIGLPGPIDTLQSDPGCVPAVTGVLVPRLVIPANWRTWSRSQRHCVLLHELAHVKRRDVAAQLLGRLASVAYWFNPLVWYALRQLRVERELASDDCVLRAGEAASNYAEQLLHTLRTYRPAWLKLGVAMAYSARLDQRVLAILDPHRPRDAASPQLTFLLSGIAAAFVGIMGTLTLTSQAADGPAPQPDKLTPASGPVWQENYAVEFPGTLPVSVAFSGDGNLLLTGDTSGEIMALILEHEAPTYRWKAKVGGSHAAIAYSADQKKIYATTKDGVRILDAATGQEHERIEVADSSPIALGVFPDRTIAEGVTRHQIVFGNSRGYFVESWIDGKLADTRGTIQTSTVNQGAQPADEAAVPLAVDPRGRSAIMTGPIDAKGESGVAPGKNIVWAYVCGDYDEGSPGNRILVGHQATVVSAAWSKEGSTAVTGDIDGRVLIWDAKTMKEIRRVELGGRVAALALSDDGTRAAAYVLGRQGEVYVWDTSKMVGAISPIHTELSDFGGPSPDASLAFSPDGKRLAGCALHTKWLAQLGELTGKVRVWEFTPNPMAQVAPKPSYAKDLAQTSSANFVLLNNESLLMPLRTEGAVDLRRIADGQIQVRIGLGNITIGGLKMSSDRKWLAIEQRAITGESATGTRSSTFDVGIYAAPILLKATIPACSQLLDIASEGKVLAVVRDKQIELWHPATAKRVKSAPFKDIRIDAATFSPDGRLLAVSARNELLLWWWQEDRFERIEMGRRVSSLAFSPDGKLLAEGPSPGKEIQVRELKSRRVVLSLTNDTGRIMNVPRLAFTQGGRVLMACDDLVADKQASIPHRIYFWDTADGSLAHQIQVPAGLPKNGEVSPNERHLVVAAEDGDRITLSGWRLDGKDPKQPANESAPAATSR